MNPSVPRAVTRRTFLLALGALAVVPALPLTACTSDDGPSTPDPLADPVTDLTTGVIVSDPDGLATCATLFLRSPAVVVINGAGSDDEIRTACATAREHGIPVLRSTDFSRVAVAAEIDRLGATHVLAPGDDWPDSLGQGRTGDLRGTALASPASGPLPEAVATASGLRVLRVPAADPRSTDKSIDAVTTATADDAPVIALGDAFGTTDDLTRRIGFCSSTRGRLPGGGGVLFPGHRLIALYGHPSGPDLGCLGEQDPAAAVARVTDLAAQYAPLSDVPVVPTFEIIASVATDQPGDAGTFARRTGADELRPWVDAITAAGGYAVLDLQPGREALLDQARVYQDLLENPHVGLALDPEWKLGPDDRPMDDIGHVDAAEINEVIDWLDTLVADNNLPQKLLMVHQFQTGMIVDRESMTPGTDHVSVAVHCDGHGLDWVKTNTWNTVRAGLDPRIALGWKNFIDEDTPMLTPDQTLGVEPAPVIVTYQ